MTKTRPFRKRLTLAGLEDLFEAGRHGGNQPLVAANKTKVTRQGESLARAAAAAFTALRALHPNERFYFFALYTTEVGSYVCATAWSEEALSKVVADYKREYPDRTVEALEHALRFSAPDSPYHESGSTALSQFERGPELHEACFEALASLDRDGYFGSGAVRDGVIINVVYGDMSDERWLAHAERLNPASALKSALPFLRLHLPGGAVSRWGRGAYQVNALSLSSDRSIVAYSGSGGEVGVLRVSDRKAIYEKTRKGQHWASVLSPDGTRLFLGDADGVGILESWTGKYTSFIRTGKPSSLALSPDGTRLLISTWDAPLSVVDAASGKGIWKQPSLKKVNAAFSPCGRWLAAAASSYGTTWTSSVWCFDASTGREVWSAPLGAGSAASIAWAPSGEALLGASSQWAYSPDGDRSGTASLAFFSPEDGRRIQEVPWPSGIDAVAVAPGGDRIALCSRVAIVILDRHGAELARGTGGQESLDDCVFVDDENVVAVGRDVNSGPALLSLSAG